MNNKTSTENGSITCLDGFRGLAILLVICYHFEIIHSWGWMGVDLFFVLSGFLITKSLTAYPINSINLKRFFQNRFLRIVPACYVSLIIFFFLVPSLGIGIDSEAYRILLQNQFYFWTFQTDIWYALDGFPLMVFLLPLWSLGVEAKFYLIWPLVIWMQSRLSSWKRYIFLGTIVLLSIFFRSYAQDWIPTFEDVYRYVFFLCRMDAFTIGAILYFLYRDEWLGMNSRYWGILATVIYLYFLILFLTGNWNGHYSSNWVSFIGFTLIAAGWAALIAFALQTTSIISHILKSQCLGWLGKYSYGMYVFHYPLWLFIYKMSLPMYLILILAIIGTLLMGYFSYKFIERPFLKLKNR